MSYTPAARTYYRTPSHLVACPVCGDDVDDESYDCTEDPMTGELMHAGCAEMAAEERAEEIREETI